MGELLMLGGVVAVAAYVASRAQASLTARNIQKNAVNGSQGAGKGDWIDGRGNVLFTKDQLKAMQKKETQTMALPLSTLDELMVRADEFNTNSKMKRRRVPTIPGLTRSKPYTSALPNNPSQSEQ